MIDLEIGLQRKRLTSLKLQLHRKLRGCIPVLKMECNGVRSDMEPSDLAVWFTHFAGKDWPTAGHRHVTASGHHDSTVTGDGANHHFP
jgi:hypothetical protein